MLEHIHYTKFKTVSGKHKGDNADICDSSTCCQAWISKEDRLAKWNEAERESNWNKIVNAVNNTQGKIITYEGKVINAFFHSNSGGKTEAPINVWGGSNYPYLQSVQTDGEDAYSQYKSEVTLTKDEFVEKIKEEHLPIIFVLNKVDRIKKDQLLKLIDEYKDLYPFSEIFPISALKNDNVVPLIQTIKKYLPNEGKIFTDDTFTNISTSFYVSEIVREKILRLTKEEVPHSVTCYLEKMDQDKDKVHLQVLIVVDRDNLKKILIGKNGSLIKKVGIEARRDLEEYFQKRVYLETYVKTIENWRDRQKYLKELGLDELDS